MKMKLPIADPGCAGGCAEASCRLPIKNRKGRPCACPIASAFTLIELLVVISIIAVLAAFTIPALQAVKRHQYLSQTQAEMGKLVAAIDSYHTAFGFYPPDNPANPLVNQLYYELEGTTNANVTTGDFRVTDNPSDELSAAQIQSAFGAGGFVNCSKPGSGEDSAGGQNFLPELKPQQTAPYQVGGAKVTLLTASVAGPDADYKPLGVLDLNPWRYKSSGTLTNNPGGYELWIQLSIAEKKYLVCNWNRSVQINSPLP
jgi:prepilin-type N-terminal cleavage/methylation domain-containing protein